MTAMRPGPQEGTDRTAAGRRQAGMGGGEGKWLIIYVGIQSPIFRSGHLHLTHAADSESIRTQSHLLRFGDPLRLPLRPGAATWLPPVLIFCSALHQRYQPFI